VDAAVQRYLTELVGAARGVLHDNLIAAYAGGSVALDAYVPGVSDVDVALVCEEAVDEDRQRGLVSMLRHEALPCPARGLELVVYRRAVTQAGTPEPAFELELNTGRAMTFRATYAVADRPAADGRFWYALDRSILHQSGHVVCGAAPAKMFAEPSPADLRTLLIEALEWWLAQPAPGSDAVLGACRALVKFRTGAWVSKAEAGRRLGYGEPLPSGHEARAFQQRVLAKITSFEDC
jgi:hypothetical protein